MDIFLEYIIKKKNNSTDIAINIGIILLALILTYVLFTVSVAIKLGTFGFILVAGIWFLVYWFFTMKSKEFEYSITNGELDIDMIIAKRKRKHLLSAKLRQIELCANVHDPDFQQALKQKVSSKPILMAASEKNAVRAYFTDLIAHDGKKYRLLWEPSPKMLEALVKFNPQNVHIYTCIEE